MNKISSASQPDRILEARVCDGIRSANEQCIPKYIGFLDSHGALVASKAAFCEKFNRIFFYGGYPEAERVFAVLLPEYAEFDKDDCPITALTFTVRDEAVLTHRDYLGSLMSLGIERDTVGDILIEKGRAVAFVRDSVARHILTSLDKIGGEGVRVQEGFSLPLPSGGGFKEIRETVASARLDAVVAGLCSTSRSKASSLIEDGLVAVDGIECKKTVQHVSDGCRITVRGYGKFQIISVGGSTKKGREILTAKKYL